MVFIVGRGRASARWRGALWCNASHADALPSRRDRGQVPGPGHPRRCSRTSPISWCARGWRCRFERSHRADHRRHRLRGAGAAGDRPRAATSRWWSAATAPCSASRASWRATTCRWWASTRAGWASSPTSPLGQYREALAPMIAGDYEEEHRSMLEGGVWRDGERIFEGLSLNDVVVSRGATASMVELRDRHRRRVRRQPARRRPDRRLAHRLDRLCAVGRRADPAPGHRRLGAGADRLAHAVQPADRAARQRRDPHRDRRRPRRVGQLRHAEPGQPAARRPGARAPLGAQGALPAPARLELLRHAAAQAALVRGRAS